MLRPPSPPPRGWISLENRFYRRATVYPSLTWPQTPADLATSVVALAPCAGPVAVVPDAGWALAYGLALYSPAGAPLARFDNLRPPCPVPVRVVALGWTRADVAVAVFSDGYIVRVALSAPTLHARVGPLVPAAVVPVAEVLAAPADSDGQRRRSDLSAAEHSKPEHVTDAVVLLEGQVVMWTVSGVLISLALDNTAHRLPGTHRPRAPISSDDADDDARGQVSASTAPGSMVATALNGSSRGLDVEVLLITDGGALTRVNANGVVPVSSNTPHKLLALSPDGKYAAIVLVSGEVVVRNMATLSEILRIAIPIHENIIPDKVAWVGPDAVAVLYGTTIRLVGPRGQVANVDLATASVKGLALSTESDGLRVLSADCLEFIQVVPETVVSVTTRRESPANKLLRASEDASAALADGASAGESQIDALVRYRLLTELRQGKQLGMAARGCVDAAYLVSDADEQQALLNAAVYGQRYQYVLGGDDGNRGGCGGGGSGNGSDGGGGARGVRTGPAAPAIKDDSLYRVPMAIATIRVLIAIRVAVIGVPVTKPQLDMLGYKGLVRRLSNYGHHALALRLCAFCGISPDDALAGWALSCIRGDESDEVVAEMIISHFDETRERLRSQPGPYMMAAKSAFAAGRSKCAEILLRRESYPALKVPLYLEMGKESLAILAAISSHDNEVVMDAIEQLLVTKSVRDVARLFKTLPAAMSHRVTDLLVTHLRQMDNSESVLVLLSEIGRHREAAMEFVAQADKVEDSRARFGELEKAIASVGRWSYRRSNGFELQSLQLALLSAQNALDIEKRQNMRPGALHGASSTKLLSTAATIRDPARRRDALMRLRRDLKIPERRFFWVVLEALASAGDMPAVEALSISAGHGRPPPIGLMAFVDVCLRTGNENDAMRYAMRIADLRDRARALARCGRGKEAADIASKLRNQQLMEEVEALVARHSSQLRLGTIRR
jgi:uncharacterized membrane protein YgcG